MENKHPKVKKTREYIMLSIGLLWLVLSWEGNRILPGAKHFSKTIPLWAIFLNLIILLITFTLLRSKKDLSLAGLGLTVVGCLISSIVWSLTCRDFPITSFVGGGAILLISQFLKKRLKE